MGNLLKMDLYRMNRAKSFRVCLILAFVAALSSTPLMKLLIVLANLVSDSKSFFPESTTLSSILGSPLPALVSMLAMLSACMFFHADMENGYIKNIAGQMPEKGYSILSRFLAVIPHNLVFMLVSVVGNLIGTLIFQRIEFDGAILASLGTFLLKFLLLQSICAILVLVAGSLRNKSLGVLLAVLLGLGLLSLVYLGINAGLSRVLNLKDFAIDRYMPDQVLQESEPDAVRAILVAAVTIGLFLPLAIRVFDRRDVK